MTKPKPLKDKLKKKVGRTSENILFEHFLKEDILSAVEWLKEQDKIVINDYFNDKIDFLTMEHRLKNNRLKAFQDVIKK